MDAEFQQGSAEPRALAAATVAPFRSALRSTGLELDRAQASVVSAMLRPVAHGFYVWGAVGRGKSMIARTYFASVPIREKRQFHFHDFFRDLQTQILRTRQPLSGAVRDLIGGARAVLFDEFHVHDVADAVYLSATLRALIDDDVLVVATSNYAPEQLLPDPVHHHRFEASIATIRSCLEVLHVDDGEDYRRRSAPAVRGFAAGRWTTGRPGTRVSPAVPLHLVGHAVVAHAVQGDAVVFGFADLCERPLGVYQYLSLADQFSSITVVDVPDLAIVTRDGLARFARLVEVLYERDVELHIRGAADPARMLDATDPPRDAVRIISRLALLRRNP